MSNRYYSRIYNGEPQVYGGGGQGADLFGIQFHRKQQLLQQQHQQALEEMQKGSELEQQEEKTRGSVAKEKARYDAVIEFAKTHNILPDDARIKAYDDASAEDRQNVAALGDKIAATMAQNRLNTLQSKPGQDAMTQADLDTITKPTQDANIARATAQRASAIELPPNTGVVYNPGGDFTKPPAEAQGPTQKITMTGGIVDPKTGQLIGARPVETYDRASFPPIARISLSGEGTTPNVQTKPLPTDATGSLDLLSQLPGVAGAIGASGALNNTNPPVGANQVMTKPQQPPIMQMAPGPQIDWQRLMQLMKQFGSNQMSTPLSMGGQ